MVKSIMTVCLAVLISCGTLLAADGSPTGLKTLYSTLGPPTNAYDHTAGLVVAGPNNSTYGFEVWLALSFTVKKASTAKRITLPISNDYFSQGGTTNGAVVGLFSDASGSPGTNLMSKDMKYFTANGDPCCWAMINVPLGAGVALKPNTTYWVVAYTDANSLDTFNHWMVNYKDTAGDFEYNEGAGWIKYNNTLPAFGVFGTIP